MRSTMPAFPPGWPPEAAPSRARAHRSLPTLATSVASGGVRHREHSGTFARFVSMRDSVSATEGQTGRGNGHAVLTAQLFRAYRRSLHTYAAAGPEPVAAVFRIWERESTT